MQHPKRSYYKRRILNLGVHASDSPGIFLSATFAIGKLRMPEKVHKKFTNGDASRPGKEKSKPDDKGSPASNHDGATIQLKTGPNGGVKRSRDGSPKNIGDEGLREESKSNSPNPKKQRTDKALNGITKLNSDSSAHGQRRGQTIKGTNHSKAILPNQRALLKTAASLEKIRQELPISGSKADIRWALRHNDVLLLNGETGSGKSTQTPQFLYTEPWCKRTSVKIKNKDGQIEDISVGGMIAITQPRRVAAITLAHRVAKEMGSSLDKGTKQGQVGYSVRFDSMVPSGTKIKFLTEGMLLQEMLRDPHLRQYSAVIVDEIHERSVDVDLISGFLRLLIHGDKKGRGGIPLKVIIMSATLDLGGLETFFAKPNTKPEYEPGENYGKVLKSHMLKHEKDRRDDKKILDATEGKKDIEDAQSPQSSAGSYSSWSGISSTEESLDESKNLTKRPKKSHLNGISKGNVSITSPKEFTGNGMSQLTNGVAKSTQAQNSKTTGTIIESPEDSEDNSENESPVAKNGVAYIHVKGRQYHVTAYYDERPTLDYLDNMLKTVFRLHLTEALPGDFLCFLTGQEEIETLKNQIEEWALKLNPKYPKIKVMPLYGSLAPSAQQEAFEKVKERFTRKIVLATNIAETSVTVSGVHVVIDCGKSKVKQYRPRLGMESLLSMPISMVSAIQRMGRAGRETSGKCVKLYTEEDERKMEHDEKPEIMRSDVIEAVLKMKARGVDDVLNFPLMDRPDIVAMEKALLQLHVMGAIDDNGSLTDAGKKMASYPLPAAYGRVIVQAAKEDCLLEAIDVISCITSDSEIFLQPKSEDEQVAVAEHRKLLNHPKGDILTYLTTIRKYVQENADRMDWCKQHMISGRAMKMALSIRRQLRQTCKSQKLLLEMPPADPQPYKELSPAQEDILLKTFVQAFVSKTALMGGDGMYVTTSGRNPVHIHPSSVLYGKKLEAILFLEHVFTAKSYGKKVSAIQAHWIEGALAGI